MSVDITALQVKVESIGIKEASNALGGLSTSAANTTKRIEALTQALSKLQSVNHASNAALTAHLLKLQQQAALMQTLTGATAGAAATTASLAAAMALLAASMNALNQRTAEADRTQRRHNDSLRNAHDLARGLSGSLGVLWMTYGNILPMIAGVALGASLKEAVVGFAKVEYQMTMVKYLTEDTTNSVSQLTARMHEVSVALGISPEAAAKGLRALAQAGLSTKDAIETLPAAFKLATVGEMELEAAALAATGVMNAYGLKVRDLERIGDTMAKAGAMSAASVSSIAVSMKYAAGTAEQYGVSLEKLSTVLTLLGKRGITGSSAGVAANNLIAEIYSPSSEKAIRAQAALGVKTYVDGVRQSLEQVVGQINENLSKFTAQAQGQLLEDMYGKKGGKAFYALAKVGQEEFLKIEKELQESTGFTAEVYKRSLETVQGQMNLTKAAITNMFAQVGEESAAPLKALMSAVQDFANSDSAKNAFVGLAQSIKTLISVGIPAIAMFGTMFVAVRTGTLVVAGLTAALGGAGLLAAYNALMSAMVALIAYFQTGNMLLLAANPIFLAILGTVTLLAGAYLLLKRNKESSMGLHAQEMQNSAETQKALQAEIVLLDRKMALQLKGFKGAGAEAELKKMENDDRLKVMQDEMDVNDRRVKALSSERRASDGAELARMTEISRLEGANKKMSAAMKVKKTEFDKEAEINDRRVKRLADYAEQARILTFSEQLMEEGQTSATVGTKTYGKGPDGAKAAAADALNAELQSLQNEINAAKKQAAEQKATTQSLYVQGLIGERAVIEMNYAIETATAGTTIGLIQAKIEAEKDATNKRALMSKHRGEIDAAEASIDAAGLKRAESIAELEVTNRQEGLKLEAEAYEAKGGFKKAFDAKFAATHDVKMAQLQSNIDMEVDAVKKGEFEKTKAAAEAAHAALSNQAEQKEAVSAFNIEVEATRNALKGVQTATEGQGIAQMFLAASDASDILAEHMVTLREKLKLIKPDSKEFVEAQAQLNNLAENQRKLWAGVGESISKSLGSAFGDAGKSIGGLMKIAEDYSNLQKKSNQAVIKSFGDAAGVAKGFFKEGTTGYKAMAAAEKAFTIIQLAEAMSVFAIKSGLLASMTTAEIAANAAKKASEGSFTIFSVAQSMIRAAWKGIEAVLNQGNGDPYTAFGRMAAMAAIVAGLGVAIGAIGGGGSAPESAESRQKRAGAGGIFGMSEETKSESIRNSIEILEKNSGLGLAHSNGMLRSLRNIEHALVGFTNIVIRSGVNGLTAERVAGSVEGAHSPFTAGGSLGKFSLGETATKGFASKIASKIIGTIFGGAVTMLDTGIVAAAKSLGSINMDGITAQQYTETKKDGGWFHSDKYKDNRTDLSGEVNRQFAGVIKNLGQGVSAAADALGIGGDAFNARLATFVVDIGKISLKDMTGEQIQEQFEAIFSKLGDDMARFGIAGLEKFQQVGEGYFETLARVANNLIQVRDVFAVLDHSFDLVGIAAIEVSEALIVAAGSVEALTEGTKFFVDNFLTEAERMAPITASVNKRLQELNLSNLTTVELYKAKVLALDLTNAADQQLYADLLALAPAFMEASNYAQDLADGTVSLTRAQKKALEAVDKARDALQKAYDKESDALQNTIDKTKAYAETLKNFQDSLKLGPNSTLTNMEKYAEARRQFDATALAAKNGDAAAQGKIVSIANEFLNASKVINASGAGYTADYNTVMAMTTDLADAALVQVDTATASLAALNLQVAGLLKLDESVLTVTQAIVNLQAAIVMGRAAGLSNTSMGLPEPVGTTPPPTSTTNAPPPALIDAINNQTGVIAGAIMVSGQQNSETIVDAFNDQTRRGARTIQIA